MTALAIDLGGTNLRAGLMRDDADVIIPLGQWKAPGDLAQFRARVDALVSESESSEIGVGIPGQAQGTACAWLPNLPFLNGVDLTALFPGTRVALGNDAHLSMLAEAAGGAAREARNAILIAIGTGIGSAVLADGRILRGEGGAATSFGWACADPKDPGGGEHGWLERMASGTALDRIAAEMGVPDGPALVARARAGEASAVQALTRPMEALGAALAGAVGLTGTQLVLFAGGVAESFDVLGPLVRRALVSQLPPHLRDVKLAAGHFGARAALVGAGLAARGHPIWAEESR